MSRPARDTVVRCRDGGPVIGSLAVKGAHLRARLAAGDRLAGTAVTLPDVSLAELTASAMDFVWIDLEHGALSARDVQPLAIAARSAGAASHRARPSAWWAGSATRRAARAGWPPAAPRRTARARRAAPSRSSWRRSSPWRAWARRAPSRASTGS